MVYASYEQETKTREEEARQKIGQGSKASQPIRPIKLRKRGALLLCVSEYNDLMQEPLSYIAISKKGLIHNVQALKSIVPHKEVVGVIKANAYGHGQNEVAKIIESYIDYFQVDDIEELRLLRKVSKKRTLVFGYVQESDLEEAVMLRGTLAVYDITRLRILQRIGARRKMKIPVHIKIDAHLGRQGLLLESIPAFIREFKKAPNVVVEGIYSHFSNIEDTTNMAHAKKQVAAFEAATALFNDEGFSNLKTHMSATSGLLTLDTKLSTSLVRLGIGLYGMWPSEALKKEWGGRLALLPVMRWVSHVAQVKNVPKGFSVGYGCTYVTKRPTTIAVIPQGYSDGFDRGLSNCGTVLIHGVRAPIVGRVAMNIIVADVTHIPRVRAEDEVVLLGSQKKEHITAEEIAKKLGTINYEITTRTSPLLPRIVR